MPAVLIVDDDADHRELLAHALNRNGYEVLQATDTDDARALIAGGGVDAALIDVRLPGESGIELCAALRANARTANLPIMLISADAGDQRISAGLTAGADEYLVKPFHRSELITRLDSMLTRTAPLAPAHAARLAARAAAALVPEPVHTTAVARIA